MSVHRSRLLRAAKLLVPFVSLQVLSQGAGVVAGFLVIRTLPVAEFAVYTLGTALQGSLSVLSDVGISSVLIAKGGALHESFHRLSALVAAARAQRRRMLIVTAGLSAPLLWLALRNTVAHGWRGTWVYLLVAATLVFQLAAAIDGTVLLVLLKPLRAQTAQLTNAFIRLLAFAALLRLAPTWGLALGINVIGFAVQALYARRSVRPALDWAARPLPEDQQAFQRIVRTQILNAAYYAFSSQITVWIVGLVGAARVVSEVGALGRLSSVFIVGNSAVASLVVPRLARINDPRLLLRRYIQVVALTLGALLLVLVWSIVAPDTLIWVLGPKYESLRGVLWLALAGALTYAVTATMFSLNMAKAWIDQAWVAVPITIFLQICAALTIDLSKVTGALVFGWISVAPALFVNVLIAIVKFRGLLERS